MANIAKQIPSQRLEFLDSYGKPTKVWYNFIANFASQSLTIPVGSGIIVSDGTDTLLRSVIPTSNRVSITNGNGASGNISVDVNQANLSIANTQITGASIGTGAVLSGSNTGDQTITLTGDVTGTGTGSFATTLANTAVTPGSYTINGQALFTVDSKGRIISASNISSISPLTTKGDLYTFSTVDDRLAVGTDGYVLSADSGETTGLKWVPAGSGTVTSVSGAGLASGTVTTSGNITVTAATQSDMETATSTTTAVVPGVVHNHPGVAKVVMNRVGNGTTVNYGYNVSSSTRASTGTHVVNFTTSFSSANFVTNANSLIATTLQYCIVQSQTTSSVSINTYNSSGTLTDPTQLLVTCFGDQ